MNILLKEIFAGIFVSIAWWNRPYDFLECNDKPSKFNSFAFTLSVVLYLRVIGGTNFSFRLMNEGNIFREFLFSRLGFNSRNSRK